jgi:hypothetical protein
MEEAGGGALEAVARLSLVAPALVCPSSSQPGLLVPRLRWPRGDWAASSTPTRLPGGSTGAPEPYENPGYAKVPTAAIIPRSARIIEMDGISLVARHGRLVWTPDAQDALPAPGARDAPGLSRRG